MNRLSLTHVIARVINRHIQGVKTIRPVVTRRAKQCNFYTCLIKVVIIKKDYLKWTVYQRHDYSLAFSAGSRMS